MSKYVPQAGTGQKKELQVSRDIWDDEEGVECQKTGGLEARRPPDTSGRWCGTATTVRDFGSLGQQGGVRITRDALVCVGFQSGLDVAPASLGQDCSLKFPFCSSVLGNVPKSPGQGKGNVAETGDDNTQNKIFCIAVSPTPNTSGPTPSSEISVRSDTSSR